MFKTIRKKMNLQEILEASTEQYTQWIIREYCYPIEADVETVEGLNQICKDMVVLANQYSYLASVLSMLKYSIRDAKDEKNKSLADSLIDKKETTQHALESVKVKQSTLSRMITIRQEINKELNMSM